MSEKEAGIETNDNKILRLHKIFLTDNQITERARITGEAFGKKAELDFGAGAEWARLRIIEELVRQKLL